MGFVGATILPHGAMIFDGDPNTDSSACRERNSTMPPDLIKDCSALYSSCERAADFVAEMSPEVVLLVTPHGISLSSGALGVYITNAACGNALWNDTWQDIEVSVPLDAQLSDQLLDFVQKQGLKADGIVTFSMMEAPLRWGEVVPLWFVKRKVDLDKVKYMVLSVGRQREGFEVIGKTLHDFASTLHQRVVVVISGDLAHTHKMAYDIPLYLPDYRSDLKPTDIAEEFDRMWEMWARGIPYHEKMESGNLDEVHPWVATHSRPWLERILKDDPIARSCGRRSIPILHSILEKEIEAGGRVTSHFLTRRAPTYYGMMSVVFNITRSSSA